ncbi:MAG: hypothetical protein RSE38_05495 [Acinetobacter sp.]
MVVDEFVIALKVAAETLGLIKAEKGLKGVEDQAQKTDSVVSKFSTGLGGMFGGLSLFATAAYATVQTTMLGAWAFLDSTIDKVEELQKSEDESIRTSKEQVEMAKKYRENMGKLGKTIESVKTQVALSFLPAMYRLSQQYSDLLEKNKELIANGISKLLSVVRDVVQVIDNFISFIRFAIEGTIGWEKALYLIIAAFVFLKRAMILAFVTNPIFWVILAIGALLLLIDDFMTHMQGGESLLGPFWEKMIGWVNKAKDIWNGFSEEAKSAIKSIGIAFALLTPMLGGVTGTFMMLGKAILFVGKAMLMNPIGLIITLIGVLIYFIVDLIKWLNGGESQFSSLWQAAADVWNKIVDATSQAIEKMINAVKKFIDDTKAYFGGIYDSIVKPFSDAFEWVSNKWQGLKGLFSGGINANVNMGDRQAAGVGANNSRVVNNNNTQAVVNVSGAGNPQAVGNAAAGAINKTSQMNTRGAAKA